MSLAEAVLVLSDPFHAQEARRARRPNFRGQDQYPRVAPPKGHNGLGKFGGIVLRVSFPLLAEDSAKLFGPPRASNARHFASPPAGTFLAWTSAYALECMNDKHLSHHQLFVEALLTG